MGIRSFKPLSADPRCVVQVKRLHFEEYSLKEGPTELASMSAREEVYVLPRW